MFCILCYSRSGRREQKIYSRSFQFILKTYHELKPKYFRVEIYMCTKCGISGPYTIDSKPITKYKRVYHLFI